VHNLSSAEEHGHLAAVAVLQEAADVLQLRLVVMFVGLGTELDFLDLNDRLFLFGFLLALLLLVLELPVVHDAADGRIGVGGHLDQVEALALRHGQGF
jgi:hypothetical protein